MSRIVDVISFALTRGKHMGGVMDVVVPLRVIKEWLRLQITSCIVVIFENEVNVAALSECLADYLCKLDKNVRLRIIFDGMHRVQPKPIEMKFLQPIEGVVDEKITNHSALVPVEINCVTPRRDMA